MTMAIAVRRTEQNQMGGAAARLRVKRAGGGNAALRSAMLAMGEPLRASGGRLMAEWKAQHHPRYRIGNGAGLFLSGDGQGVVSCSREAWFGTVEQAERALAKFPAARGMRALRAIENKLPHLSKQLHL